MRLVRLPRAVGLGNESTRSRLRGNVDPDSAARRPGRGSPASGLRRNSFRNRPARWSGGLTVRCEPAISSRRREARPAPLFLMSCLLKIESGLCITHSSCSTLDPSPSNGCVRSTGHRACCFAHGSQSLCSLERRSSRNPGSQRALEGSAHDTDVIWLMKRERHPAIYSQYARRPLPQAWPAEGYPNPERYVKGRPTHPVRCSPARG
jgi:hypothetical protein